MRTDVATVALTLAAFCPNSAQSAITPTTRPEDLLLYRADALISDTATSLQRRLLDLSSFSTSGTITDLTGFFNPEPACVVTMPRDVDKLTGVVIEEHEMVPIPPKSVMPMKIRIKVVGRGKGLPIDLTDYVE